MKRKIVSGIMLTLLFIGMLTLAFSIRSGGAECCAPPCNTTCPWDVNNDNRVNVMDLICILTNLGPVHVGTNDCCDVDGSTQINVIDLIWTLINLGPCP